MIMEPKQSTHYNYFLVFSLLCSYSVAVMIKKTRIAFSGSYKIEFWQTQISVPKIGTPMSKTVCINPWELY